MTPPAGAWGSLASLLGLPGDRLDGWVAGLPADGLLDHRTGALHAVGLLAEDWEAAVERARAAGPGRHDERCTAIVGDDVVALALHERGEPSNRVVPLRRTRTGDHAMDLAGLVDSTIDGYVGEPMELVLDGEEDHFVALLSDILAGADDPDGIVGVNVRAAHDGEAARWGVLPHRAWDGQGRMREAALLDIVVARFAPRGRWRPVSKLANADDARLVCLSRASSRQDRAAIVQAGIPSWPQGATMRSGARRDARRRVREWLEGIGMDARTAEGMAGMAPSTGKGEG